MLNGKWYTFKGDNSVKIVFAPFWKKGLLWKKRTCSPWEQILSLKSRSFLRKGLVCRKSNRSYKKLSPLSKMAENLLDLHHRHQYPTPNVLLGHIKWTNMPHNNWTVEQRWLVEYMYKTTHRLLSSFRPHNRKRLWTTWHVSFYQKAPEIFTFQRPSWFANGALLLKLNFWLSWYDLSHNTRKCIFGYVRLAKI